MCPLTQHLENPNFKKVGFSDAMELNMTVCPQPLPDICSVIEKMTQGSYGSMSDLSCCKLTPPNSKRG